MVILIPDRYQVNATLRAYKARLYGDEFSTLDPDRPTRLVIDVLAAKGVTVVDASPCLAGDGPYYYVGDNHLTESGHRRVADCIGPRMAEVLDPRRPVRHTP